MNNFNNYKELAKKGCNIIVDARILACDEYRRTVHETSLQCLTFEALLDIAEACKDSGANLTIRRALYLPNNIFDNIFDKIMEKEFSGHVTFDFTE